MSFHDVAARVPYRGIVFLLFPVVLFLLLGARFVSLHVPLRGERFWLAVDEQGLCSPEEYSAGRWQPKWPLLHQNRTELNVFEASEFPFGCAQEHAPWWFLGTNTELKMSKYRWDASQYYWNPPDGPCREVGEGSNEDMVRQLVEGGGWLLIGDSLTESQVFSLSCVLSPHVRVVPGPERSKSIFLRDDSPLIPTLKFPSKFTINSTSLVTHVWSDHGFSKDDMVLILNLSNSADLFTDYPVTSLAFDHYFSHFFDPAQNYHALIISVGAHFTSREFVLPEGRPAALPDLYSMIATIWVERAISALDREDPGGTRELVVRGGGPPGHHNCQAAMAPLDEIDPVEPEEFNWRWIPRFNEDFKNVVLQANHPRLSFLDIARPFRLRPDAHAHDCLHPSVGTGIVEGWSEYTSYFLSKKRLRPQKAYRPQRPHPPEGAASLRRFWFARVRAEGLEASFTDTTRPMSSL